MTFTCSDTKLTHNNVYRHIKKCPCGYKSLFLHVVEVAEDYRDKIEKMGKTIDNLNKKLKDK